MMNVNQTIPSLPGLVKNNFALRASVVIIKKALEGRNYPVFSSRLSCRFRSSTQVDYSQSAFTRKTNRHLIGL